MTGWGRSATRRWVLVGCISLVVATLSPMSSAEADSSGLEAATLQAVIDARFEETIDFGPFEDVCPMASFCEGRAGPVAYMPNVDVAVIELGPDGRATRAANVLLSRDHPSGITVAIDPSTYEAGQVRWRRWDIDRYNGGTFNQTTGEQETTKGWTDNPALTAADDIVAGREAAPVQFMAPYPASLFKIVVAFRIMRLVDAGQLSLKQRYTYAPTATVQQLDSVPGEKAMSDRPLHGRAPRAGARSAARGETRTIADWMEPMITVSDNTSTKALLKLLHDRNDFPAMHAELRGLGLRTLQINGTDPATGGNWQPGSIHMTSMDTARLLWLVEGGQGTLWTRPDGSPVTAAVLSASSRSYLRSLLDDQGFHEALSTSNFCGAPNVEPGIPARVPSRWIDRRTGTVTVDGFAYGQDVRPCNAAAEVVFGHKTGLTFNYGSNAGIVRSLPGQPDRRYVISFISSLGWRYTDPVFVDRRIYPCYDAVGPICYTQRIPALARQLDGYLKSSPGAL
jgi:hypothetical protein